VCDDTKFEKYVSGPLYEVRNMAGPGLFTAFSNEKEWKLAHKLLLPVFGPLGIQKMFPEMLDITSQMLMKWQRLGDGAVIDPVDAFTRLTLDTIALCAFDYRFNSSFMLPF
jgi:cytochrome P450 / NADPH-cytochrome P450 reductase